MKIYVIIYCDGFDSGNCFIEAHDSEEAAFVRCEELNANRKEEDYYYREYELNSKAEL